eukprot:TRINITY_DN293_c0_g1_i1.p1 TRINITY_DN293_c0_g1~~TRINITY_DN293_c0_g1_i1.p1  ORF type:complete len:446 (+),score=108.35 TRINITY_DN293_c0_g1_i1:200-1537(+)
MGKNTVSRANHKTNKRMSIFRYSQIRSYKTVPNDFFVELKRYFVTQGFKIKRFSYTETSGQMVGRKDGWHLNFVPKFILDIKQVNGVHFITFNYFARVRKIGIATGIATQGITAIVGAATITGYLAAARNLVDAVGKAMDVLAGNPLSVEWLEKEEAGEQVETGNNTNSQSVTYNTTNIQNVQAEPSREASTSTVVEHHHHYYYGGANNEFAQPMPPQTLNAPSVPAIEAHHVAVEEEAPARLAIMPAEPAQPFYRQCDLEKELIAMMGRGEEIPRAAESYSAPDPFADNNTHFTGGYSADATSSHHNNRMPSPHMFHGGAMSSVEQSAPARNLFDYEDEHPLPQYNLPVQSAPLYSIEPLSYKQQMVDNNSNNVRLEEIRQIQPVPITTTSNPFFDVNTMNSKPKVSDPNDPFADLSLDNVAGAFGLKPAHPPSHHAEYGYASR